MGVHVVVGLIHLAVALMLQVEAGMGFGNTLKSRIAGKVVILTF